MATDLISHVGIAVVSLETSIPLYESILGFKAGPVIEISDQNVRVVMFAPKTNRGETYGAAVELLEATSDDSPIAHFLSKHGEGLHHICFYVDDIESRLKELGDKGARLIDASPRLGAMGHKIAFVHPDSAGGVLVELEERSI